MKGIAVNNRWPLTETWLRADERKDYGTLVRVAAVIGGIMYPELTGEINSLQLAVVYWAREYEASTRGNDR